MSSSVIDDGGRVAANKSTEAAAGAGASTMNSGIGAVPASEGKGGKDNEWDRLVRESDELLGQGYEDLAIESLRKAVSAAEKALGHDHREVAHCLSKLAALLGPQSRPAEAGPLLERSLAILERAQDLDRLSMASALSGLGVAYLSKGEYGKAEPLFKRALDGFENSLNPDPGKIAMVLHNLAMLHMERGSFGTAAQLLVRVLEIEVASADPDSDPLADNRNTVRREIEEALDNMIMEGVGGGKE